MSRGFEGEVIAVDEDVERHDKLGPALLEVLGPHMGLSVDQDGTAVPVVPDAPLTPAQILAGIDLPSLLRNALRPPVDTSAMERGCGAATGVRAETFEQTLARLTGS